MDISSYAWEFIEFRFNRERTLLYYICEIIFFVARLRLDFGEPELYEDDEDI